MATYGADRGGKGRSIAGTAARRRLEAKHQARPCHFLDGWTGLIVCGERVGLRQRRAQTWGRVTCPECLAKKP